MTLRSGEIMLKNTLKKLFLQYSKIVLVSIRDFFQELVTVLYAVLLYV